jgi:uncharacterized membrane protein YjjP (DUF1212 family)
VAKVRLNAPLQWENWCGWLLAIWLCISPGPLKFGDDLTATYIAVLTGIVLLCTEMLTISPFRLWEEWINVCVGVWLIVASWLLNVSSPSAKINFVIVGALVVILAVYKLWNGAAEKQGAIGRLDS